MWPFKRKRKPNRATLEVSVASNVASDALALYTKRYPVLDRHFELTEQLRNTYTPSSEKAVEKGIKICREMISVSEQAKAAFEEQERNLKKAIAMRGDRPYKSRGLPSHMGFRQLAIILEKRGEFEEAIQVSKQARTQGWNGDWEKRIARCESKIAKRRTS